MTRLFALIGKLWGTWVLLLWLPLCLFILTEWLKAMRRVWQLPRAEAARAFMWWARAASAGKSLRPGGGVA
jgi:hypothetical protein